MDGVSGRPCGSLVVILANRGARKMPLLTRARNRFTRSAPSDGTDSWQLSDQRPRSMHHRSLIRNSSLERTIRLMSATRPPPGSARMFWVPGHNFKHDFPPITCPSHGHGSTDFSSAIWHVFYSFPTGTRRSFLVTVYCPANFLWIGF